MKRIKKIGLLTIGLLISLCMSVNAQIIFTQPERLSYAKDPFVGENIIRSQNGTCFLKVTNETYWYSHPDFTIYYSEDGANWEVLIDEVTRYAAQFDPTKAMYLDAYTNGINGVQLQLVETEDGYLALPGKAGNETRNETTTLYILDKNLQVQSTMFENSAIGRISYLDGIYYIENYIAHLGDRIVDPPKQSEYRCSPVLDPDLSNWKKCDGMPIVSEGHVLYVTERMGQEEWGSSDELNVTGTAKLYGDGQPQQEIVYEDFKIANIKTAGGYFIGQLIKEGETLKAAFSKDGVYFVTEEIPLEHEDAVHSNKIYAAFEKPDGRLALLFKRGSSTYRTYCNISDIEETVPKSDLYVQVKDKILGFSTPPVMENDRTLVPMRFLFEQLGAEVEWDNDTQTATATIPAQNAAANSVSAASSAVQPLSISFSIDNTTAQVNGQAKTMDVPARMVNDKTMVPLRFLSEQMGYTVTWDQENNTAIVE